MERSTAHRVALACAAPYRVAMSSLGLQTIYRVIQQSDDLSCERVFLPDEPLGWDQGDVPTSCESGRALGEFEVIAFSVSWELELIELVRMLQRAGIPPLRRDRADHHPLLIAGGPLTFSNPRPLLPFVDAVVLGEADTLAVDVLTRLFDDAPRASILERIAGMQNVIVPAVDPASRATPCHCDASLLPAWGPIRTPHTELRDMFLVEAVRGCSRSCHYCVMRRGPGAGMRVVPEDRLLATIPQDASRVGLVGASVTDHPRIEQIVRALAARGASVGLSSLRADRLRPGLVDALRQGGYRTLTTAMDGASERLRDSVERHTSEVHLREAARLCREHGIERLKLYVMVGLPTEQQQDIDECAALVRELSRVVPVSLGISPFCAKRNTPLDGAAFAGLKVIDERLDRLRKKLAGAAEVRATSARWAWVEHVLAQGDEPEGMAVVQAAQNGGGFSAFRKAFAALGHEPG